MRLRTLIFDTLRVDGGVVDFRTKYTCGRKERRKTGKDYVHILPSTIK